VTINEEMFALVVEVPSYGFKDLLMHDLEGPIWEVDEHLVQKRLDRLVNLEAPTEDRIYSIKKVKLISIGT
jgi:hypothetical protein